MRWVTVEHGSPPVYHLAAILAFCCHELARRGFHLRQRHKPFGIWFALVGDSAMGKSTAINFAEDFMRDVWHNASLSLSPDPWVEMEGSVSGLLAAIHGHYESSRGTTVCMAFHHELASVFATREPISEMLCRLADGQTYQRNIRELQKKGKSDVGAQPDRIVNPVISGLFATTEAALEPHFGEAQRSGGIFSRLWWVKPIFNKSYLRFEVESDANEVNRDMAVDLWVGWLAQLSMLKSESLTFSMSTQAQDMLRDGIWAKHREEMGDDVDPVKLRVIDKTKVIAAVYAAMRGSVVVEVQDLQYAVAFAGWLTEHSLRVSSLGAPKLVRLADRLEGIVRGLGEAGATRKDFYGKMRVSKGHLDEVIETALDRGTIVKDNSTSGTTRYLAASTERAHELAAKAKIRSQAIDITGPGSLN